MGQDPRLQQHVRQTVLQGRCAGTVVMSVGEARHDGDPFGADDAQPGVGAAQIRPGTPGGYPPARDNRPR
jgi:hypothetical protein